MSPARVAVIAPSSPFPVEEFERGLAWLRARVEVRVDPRCLDRLGYLAGHDDARAAGVLDALRDPDVRCLWAARGGYGVTRLLERHGDAMVEALRRDPKPVVGFSDATALHAVWARAGVPSIHGAMVSALGRADVARGETWATLTGEAPAPWEGLEPVCGDGRVEGVARGGNLSLLAALVGTPWQLDLRGAVLFLEDVNEAPYRVDRMLTTLRLARALDGVAAVVLGDFSGGGDGPDGATVDLVLWERLEAIGVPVLAGAPFGHGKRQRPWVSGGRVAVDAARGTVTLDPLGSPFALPYRTAPT